MLIESQYSQFKEDLNKPKGGVAFITDFDRKEKLLAIGHGLAQAQSKAGAVAAKPAENKPIIVAAPPIPQENDLPKF